LEPDESGPNERTCWRDPPALPEVRLHHLQVSMPVPFQTPYFAELTSRIEEVKYNPFTGEAMT